MNRKNLPEWSLIVLPKLTGTYTYQQVADIIQKTSFDEEDP
jgi:hypothetical protein